MEKYIFVSGDGELEAWKGELPASDIQYAIEGHIIILRLSDHKYMWRGDEWVDIEFGTFENQ